jgi:diacylglycerol kinase (ATP)
VTRADAGGSSPARIGEQRRAETIEHSVRESQALAALTSAQREAAPRPLVGPWSKRRALLVVNSKSGPNRDSLLHARELADLLAAFRIRADVRVKLHKSQTRKEVREAARGGRYDLVIAAGGDGTVEAVARGLVGSKVPLGIIPLGTYNNLATSLGIPTDIRQACALIGCGQTRRVDAGQMIARYMKKPRLFFEVSTVGVGAMLGTLGQHLEKGRWAAASSSLPGVLDMSLTPTRVRLDGGASHVFNTLLVTISNSPRSAAGLKLAPDARMDDGLLDIRVYQDLQQAALAASLLPVVLNAPSRDESAQIWQGRAACIEIHTTTPMPVSVETKLVGATPARFTIVQGAVSVIVGDTDALVDPVAPALIRASRVAATALSTASPATPPTQTAPGPIAQAGLATRAAQAVLPAAGRTIDIVSSARPLALPLATAVLGVAAGVLLPRRKQLKKPRN